MRSALIVALIFTLSQAGIAADSENERNKSIKDLNLLIGSWRYVDQSTENAGFNYREEGTIECAYAFNEAYIQCNGTGHYNNKTRTFIEYINYNQITKNFERVGIFENHPAKAIFTLTVSADGKTIEQFGAPMHQRDGTVTKNWGSIRFSDENHYTWQTRVNYSNEAPDHWPVRFISTYERITSTNQ
ncbi:DUF1579 family protein [Kordiimonas aquimaris]|uniref:DUF1579 family protein n=1 Tax=Kordiimonas aquimaris TaxID=707591 RepID=UPI0021CE9381|nr:hypothetical protein [Kordiimonas aquimaris]